MIAMMVRLNGTPQELDSGATLQSLIQSSDFSRFDLAIWINERQLMYAEYANTPLHDGDEVKIIRLMGGG